MLPTRDDEISVVFSRHKFAYEYLKKFVEQKTVIDVGCGTGYGCKILAEKARLVYGLDYDQEAIAYCCQHYLLSNVEYILQDATSIKLDRQFDVAVSLQVIEHMTDLANFLKQLKRVVKPGGTLFISTPNVKKSEERRSDNPFHHNEMNYSQFSKLLRDHFTAFEILGITYARHNRMRSMVGKLPFYKWGRKLKRSSKLKKVATRALDLTSFKVIDTNVEKDGADLLAVCQNINPIDFP
ncbi:class I SAM-dependent methyltransferase [bacterium]|nr:class I SAM-dependent methyltransferase [bacterium]